MIDTPDTQLQPVVEHDTAPAAAKAPPPNPAALGDEFPLEPCLTALSEICYRAVADVKARYPGRAIEYAPDAEVEGTGEWDPRRVTYAITILLEDALKRTPASSPVCLRWREHDGVVALRVQYPRPLERGDRFVTTFDDGVQPDGADDSVGTLRILAALRIARQHRGSLARIRTRAGTAYVLELPRGGASTGATDAPSW